MFALANAEQAERHPGNGTSSVVLLLRDMGSCSSNTDASAELVSVFGNCVFL